MKDLAVVEKDDGLLSVAEAARLLQLGKSTVNQHISAGTFPVGVIMIGNRRRISRAELLEYMRSPLVEQPNTGKIVRWGGKDDDDVQAAS